MKYYIKNCRILRGDGNGIVNDGIAVTIENGVSKICPSPENANEIIDGKGALLMPAFTDIGAKFFDPSHPLRDTEGTASASATAGGYRRIVTYPDGYTVNKCSDPRVRYALPIVDPDKIAENGAQLYYGESGKLSSNELGEVFAACKASGSLYISSGIDMNSVGNGALASGMAAKMNGCEGISRYSECSELSKELFLAYETKARLHISAISTKEALDMICFAKSRGVSVTCGVSPYHLCMTDSDIAYYGTNGKILPPLRSSSDKNALREGVFNGDIDCICSLHTPFTKTEKNQPIAVAPFGVSGIETAFSALITYMPELMSERPDRIAQLMALAPAEIIGEDASLSENNRADFVLVDTDNELVVTENTIKSKSVNTPFLGQTLNGYVTSLFINGRRF